MTTRIDVHMFGFQTGAVSQIWLKNLALIGLMIGSTVALFVIDVDLERGTLDGYPYLAPLVFASFIRARNVAFPAALMLSIVAIVGFAHSDPLEQIVANELVGLMNVAIAIAALFGTAFAIEHHRHLRAELGERLDQLRAGEEMRHRILSVIGHDLRSPLMPIIGFGDLLAGHKSRLSDEQVVEYGEGIASSGHRLLDTLDKLLDWARSTGNASATERKPLDLVGLVDNEIALLEPVAGSKGIRLTRSGTQAQAYSDPVAVGTIIRNLMSNAIKFSPTGSDIRVTIDTVGNEATISVADQGVGMPLALVNTLNSAGPVKSRMGTGGETGTGLGLAICRSLAERNGGTLMVASQEGAGTTVTVTLPRGEN